MQWFKVRKGQVLHPPLDAPLVLTSFASLAHPQAFFDQVAVTREDYDPLRVRQKGKGGANATKFLNEKVRRMEGIL